MQCSFISHQMMEFAVFWLLVILIDEEEGCMSAGHAPLEPAFLIGRT